MIIYLVLRTSDGSVRDAFTSKPLAEKSLELSISRLSEAQKEEARNDYSIVPQFVKDRVDHL